MPQHDLSITNADANTGITIRSQLNGALQALGTLQSGATEPTVTYAYMLWADTGNSLLKMRNSTNTDWKIIGSLNEDYLALMPKNVAQTIPVQHTFNPVSVGVPFFLGTNALGQLVTGLNSDKLDGYEATALAKIAENHTISGIYTFSTAPVLSGTAWPSFNVHRNAVNQTIVASTPTKIEFTTESWDTNSNFDNVTNFRFLPTVVGYYLLIGTARYNGPFVGSDKIMRAMIYKNGAEYKQVQRIKHGTAGDDSVTVEAIINANGSSDYYELWTYHTDSASKDILGSYIYTNFQGIRIG